MSRSRRKTPIFKIKNDVEMKCIFNKKLRRNLSIDEEKEPNKLNNSRYKKLNSTWDICDYREAPRNKKEIKNMTWEEKKDAIKK